MDEMLKKQDVLDAIYAKMEKTDKPDVVLGLAAAMSVVKKMEALEQEPCIDAISRQAVLEIIRKCHCEEWVKADIGAPIEALQPVTPAEKVGHWRDTGSGQECSECGEIQYGYDSFRKYCANCGAKMGGEQNESDD